MTRKSYTRYILIAVFCIIVLSLGLGLGLGLRRSTFSNIESNSKAFIIATSNEAYNTAKTKLSNVSLNIQMFDAIKGADITKSGLIKDVVTIKALYDILVAENRRSHSDLGTANGVGCYLSHVTLWKQLLNDNVDGYYIFESDAVCRNDIKPLVAEFLNKPDPHILFFGIIGFVVGPGISKLTRRFYGTHAYYITKEGARRCLEHASPIEEQIDSYLSDLFYFLKITVLVSMA